MLQLDAEALYAELKHGVVGLMRADSVLVDRGGRELPIAAAFAAAKIVLPAAQKLTLAREDDGRFSFAVKEST